MVLRGAAGCRVTYTFALRDAGVASREKSVAEVRGDVVEAPPSVWLLRPLAAPDGSAFRFHVTSPPGESFATGVFPVAGAADTYEGRTVTPFDLPYAAFGPLRRVPFADGHVEVAYLPGTFHDDAAVTTWLERSAEVVESYYERPPVPRLLVLLSATRGSKIGMGTTMGSSGALLPRRRHRDPHPHRQSPFARRRAARPAGRGRKHLWGGRAMR